MFTGICAEDADPDAASLAKDVSGNFVVQKLFDVGGRLSQPHVKPCCIHSLRWTWRKKETDTSLGRETLLPKFLASCVLRSTPARRSRPEETLREAAA